MGTEKNEPIIINDTEGRVTAGNNSVVILPGPDGKLIIPKNAAIGYGARCDSWGEEDK